MLITHTREQLEEALRRLENPSSSLVFDGRHWDLELTTYAQAFLDVQERWKGALNCWSASESVPERVLSNWYIIPEGISLYGARYDSTEHFWQAVKYHPAVRLEDLTAILDRVEAVDWEPWLEALRADVLNGIAYRPETKTFLLTGKLWPYVFEVELVPR